MKKLAAAWVLLMAALPAVAQLSERPVYNNDQQSIPEGTRFIVVLDDKLDTAKVERGKKFDAKLAEDLIAPDGTVIPRGKKLKGHVAEVERGFSPRLLLTFREIDTRKGKVPIAATVVSIPGERQVKTETGKEGEIEGRKIDKKRTITAAAIGAGAGAVAGAAMGGGKGAIIGAAVGAGAGTGAGILTNRDFKLEKGTQLELQLDRPLRVPR